jgi:hypothetical protein
MSQLALWATPADAYAAKSRPLFSDFQKPAPPPNCRTMVSARLKLWRPLRLPMQADTLNNGCDGIVNKSEFKSFA